MPKISSQKRDKIKEQILHFLFSVSPEMKYTSDIAREIARDEEFVKTLLHELKKDSLVISTKKAPSGELYLKRTRWTLSPKIYSLYSSKQSYNNNL